MQTFKIDQTVGRPPWTRYRGCGIAAAIVRPVKLLEDSDEESTLTECGIMEVADAVIADLAYVAEPNSLASRQEAIKELQERNGPDELIEIGMVSAWEFNIPHTKREVKAMGLWRVSA